MPGALAVFPGEACRHGVVDGAPGDRIRGSSPTRRAEQELAAREARLEVDVDQFSIGPGAIGTGGSKRVELFDDARITNVARYPEGSPGPAGEVMSMTFQLEGQEFIALNGGPQFTFTQAISFLVHCETQDEVDRLWEQLSEGGEQQQCGWLVDRFGLSWQIVPNVLGELLGGSDAEGSRRAMQAMLQGKIDIKTLQDAYDRA